jgi:hypothetical protein
MAIPEGERKTSETREAMVDRLRSSNPSLSKQVATKIADDSLRRVEGRIERGTLHRDRPSKP